MSIEIKYRVKVTWCDEVRIAQVTEMEFGKWIEGVVIGKAFFALSSYSAEDVDFETSPATGDVLMQYTGLKDKNGVEIYEGYIVVFEEVRSYRGVIKFQKGMFFIEWESHCYIRNDLWHFFEQMDRFEVIGNIHENPELLEAINEQGND